METRKITGMLLLICTVAVGSVQATTYYVATNGNDSNPGTEQQPWKTIQKAADTMIAGDTVNIKAGTYVEQVEPNNSGSEGNWITYQAYQDDEVTIKSPNDVPDGENYCIILYRYYPLEYLHFKNLTLEGADQEVTKTCFVAGGNTTDGEVKSHIILERLTIKNAYYGVDFALGVTDSNIIDCNIYDNGYGIKFAIAVHNILINGNHISYCHDDRIPYYNFGDGIVMTGTYSQIPDGNMCSDITITNNIVHDVNRQGMLISASKNVLIRGNHCHHNGGTGIQIESNPSDPCNVPICRNIVIEDNLCEDNACEYAGETGIWVDDNNDVLVQNNILRRNEVGLAITGAFNVIARNNIIYENSDPTSNITAGILVSETTQRGACGNNIIVHNTLYRNAGEASSVFAQVVIGRIDGNWPADNAVFKNNISSCSLAGKYCTYLDLMVYGQNQELNYNNYYQPVKPLHVCWQSDPDVNIISWSQYQTSGQDSHSITSDPCFINIDNEDFHLRPDSKCIDAGGFLTTADGNGADTNNLVVADSRYFTDGYGLVDGDLIKVGSNSLVRVLDVNYDTNTLTLSENISWNDGDGVSYSYLGNAPDIGAYEYGPLIYNKNRDTSYESIQAAIDEASSSDEIIVYPGTYYESVDFNGVACTLRSANSNDWDVVGATVIDGNGANNSVLFNSGEGNGSVLTGFTITGGAINGIYCQITSPIVSKCIIRNNATRGLYSSLGAPTITNNKIYNNGDYNIYLQFSTADLTIKNNLIYDSDYGIRVSYPQEDVTISNNTIVKNKIRGILKTGGGTSPTITNCIVWDCNDDLLHCSATYSCIQDGNPGTGNISSDPCFVNADSNNFHISIHSPCVNAGNPNGNYDRQVDIDGDARVIDSYANIGADEVSLAHWWKFDECSGVTAYDSVDDYDGTFNGNDPCWVPGKFGCGVNFNGVNDYFSVSSLDDAYDEDSIFTIAGWFKTNQSAGTQTIVGQWSQDWEAGREYYGWQVLVENNKVVARFGYEIYTPDITGTTNVNVGEWYHFVMVRNGTNVVLYVNGQPEDSNIANFYVDDTKFRIGDGSYGSGTLKGGPFNGIIDDVMIFNKALSDEEVEQLY